MAPATWLPRLGAVVLLKGPTTVVADPGGEARFITTGDERLATAGTGDVLAGTSSPSWPGGASALEAASAGAWLHGRAACLGPADRAHRVGDLVDALPTALAEAGR